jgi:DNA-binding NarL/FixJ family response regulator
MPGLSGLEAGRQVKKVAPTSKLIFLTMYEDADLAAEAFRSGASAYLLKRSATSELMTAIREVMKGRSYVTPLVTEGLVGSLLQVNTMQPSPELTSRQREVLRLLSAGHSIKEVAALLNLTPRTIAFHKYAMMEALNIKSTAELIRYAVMRHIA